MKFNKLLAVSMSAVLSLTLVGCSTTTSAKELKGEELNKIQKDDKEKENYLVIDIREEAAYKQGHLKHAINIPVSKIDKSIEQIRLWREKKVVVYSDNTNTTNNAVEKLTKQGFKDVTGAQNIKDYKYDLVKYTSLNGSQFQDALLDTTANNVFLDVRDKADFEKGHGAGAKNIDVKNLDNLQSVLPENKEIPIYVYSVTGTSSSVVAQKLIDLGYKNVFNAIDGTKEFSYKFEIADCCKDPSDEVKGSEKHEGHCEHCKEGHGEHKGHEGHNHSSDKKDEHAGHNHSSDKKDDHSGHNH